MVVVSSPQPLPAPEPERPATADTAKEAPAREQEKRVAEQQETPGSSMGGEGSAEPVETTKTAEKGNCTSI